MRSFAPRFSTPLDAPRPRGARLLEGFSPKLGRRIRLFDRATFDLWLCLEADPTVLCLCERPLRLSPARGSRLVDFWVHRDDGEQLLLVEDGEDDLSSPTASDIPLRRVAAADLAAAATWISNWQRMLPTIVCTGAWMQASLPLSIFPYVREPMALLLRSAISASQDR
ncbi:hypothetical protein QTI66_27905 [Variovorax sp. J22R133]|uniref:hypothetical protein n=1 Tax=Variovorax brevis TaxID=3053503 RepID=UPI00257647E2|nr:hypothetical protein [Variovorax sp. J22R133]MDM0116003.1 hypothetical protein [Variovorax sp. J22R133]